MNLVPLLIAARRSLGVSQGKLGELLGSSRHTGQRWESAGSTPMPSQLHDLARMVHPSDPKLAAELAAAGQSSLEALGIVLPAPPPAAPAPPAKPPPPLEDVVDAVVCAAAEAIDVLPKAIRPALRAAFARARRLGLTVEEVEKALGGKAAEAAGAAAPRRQRPAGT
jgi:transcriptional regulator with XRE-family HTH domain